jgi:hypothetical protein
MRQWLRRPWVAGTLAAVVTAAVGITLVVLLLGDDGSATDDVAQSGQIAAGGGATGSGSGDGSGGDASSGEEADARDDRRSTSRRNRREGSARRSTSTTTRRTLPATGASTPSSTTPKAPGSHIEPPDPPDPADAYEPLDLPPGFSAQITSCTWNAGRVRATGSVTYNGTEPDEGWFVEAIFLARNGNQNEEVNAVPSIVEFTPGMTHEFDLSNFQTVAPPNLSCALEITK